MKGRLCIIFSDIQLLSPRHGQHGGSGSLRHRGAEETVAHPSLGGKDTLLLRDDRTGGRQGQLPYNNIF